MVALQLLLRRKQTEAIDLMRATPSRAATAAHVQNGDVVQYGDKAEAKKRAKALREHYNWFIEFASIVCKLLSYLVGRSCSEAAALWAVGGAGRGGDAAASTCKHGAVYLCVVCECA